MNEQREDGLGDAEPTTPAHRTAPPESGVHVGPPGRVDRTTPQIDTVRRTPGIPPAWEVGTVVLGLYRVDELIEDDRVNVVHRVRHLGWDVDLAVRSVHAQYLQNPFIRRHVEEATADWVSLGRHAHVVTCEFVQHVDGVPRAFCEWVREGTLADLLASGRVYEGPGEAITARLLDIAIQSAWGLSHFHASGLAHGDVKPQSLLLTDDCRVKVDLPPGLPMLIAEYCSPEQSDPERPEPVSWSTETDAWSWGLVVLELFCGERPTDRGERAADALASFKSPAGKRIPALPDPVRELLRRCFERNPSERPGLSEAAEALIAVYESELGPYPRRRPEPATPPAERRG